jgi:hypothetical protein
MVWVPAMAVSTRERVIREAKRSVLHSVRLNFGKTSAWGLRRERSVERFDGERSAEPRSVERSVTALMPKSALRYRGRRITIDVAGVLVPVLNYQWMALKILRSLDLPWWVLSWLVRRIYAVSHVQSFSGALSRWYLSFKFFTILARVR